MGKGWLPWIHGGVDGGGGAGNSKSTAKKAAESGCMCAVFHLFQSHNLHFPSSHRNHSRSNPFIQETITTRGVEAPRNSLEFEEENLNFPVGIQIKTKSRFNEISSECNSPSSKTPIIARLMGLDLLPQSSPSSSKSNRDEDVPFGVRSLPDTPRVSSSSRKSDVERHRLSLQINEEFTLSNRARHKPSRRGRFLQNENRNLVQRAVSRRSVGTDITNTVVHSRRDEDLLQAAKKNSNNQILMKNDVSFGSGRRVLDHKKSKMTSFSCDNYVPSQKDCKRGAFSPKCNNSSRLKKLPRRGVADSAVRGRREGEFVNKLNLRDKIVQVKKFKSHSPPPTKLPQKLLVSDSLSSKNSTQLSSKASQSYKHLQIPPPQTTSSCSGAAATHGGSSLEQRNYIQTILKHTGIINRSNPLPKWHSPSHPIDPGIFHHLELSSAVDGGDRALSHQCNRKLVFQLVDELLAEILMPRVSSGQWVSAVGGVVAVEEELCKKIESFPVTKCVVLEDIDALIDTDLCKSRLTGCFGEEEEVVSEIEKEVVERLLWEAVAVMGGDAAAESRVLFGGE